MPEKEARKVKKVFKVPEIKKYGQVVDLFIFPSTSMDGVQYNMYLIFEHGILFYPAVDRKTEPLLKLPEASG